MGTLKEVSKSGHGRVRERSRRPPRPSAQPEAPQPAAQATASPRSARRGSISELLSRRPYAQSEAQQPTARATASPRSARRGSISELLSRRPRSAAAQPTSASHPTAASQPAAEAPVAPVAPISPIATVAPIAPAQLEAQPEPPPPPPLGQVRPSGPCASAPDLVQRSARRRASVSDLPAARSLPQHRPELQLAVPPPKLAERKTDSGLTYRV